VRKMPPGRRSISQSTVFRRRRREPFLDMLGHVPRRPYELGRDVDHALQNEIKPRIVLYRDGHFISSSVPSRYLSSDRGGAPTAPAVAPSSALPLSAAGARADRCALGCLSQIQLIFTHIPPQACRRIPCKTHFVARQFRHPASRAQATASKSCTDIIWRWASQMPGGLVF